MKTVPLYSVLLAAGLLAGANTRADDAFARILERPYIPAGTAPAVARPGTSAAKSLAHVLTETELLGQIEKELARQLNLEGELRLTFGRPWQTFRVPSEQWQISLPEMPIGGLSKSFLLRVRIVANERTWFDQQLVVQAQLWKSALVSTRRVERGQPLDRAAVEAQTIDVLRERQTPVAGDTNLEEQEVLQTIAEGRPLTWKDIAPMPMVRKGAVVDVIAGEGGLSISMKGLAMGTGGAGDAITVRNMDTRKDFQARVVNRSTVSVSF
jgi:flagella basal body P-ring formation protein FlgA